MKMRLNMKNTSHRYDVNRTRPRHGHKYTRYKIVSVYDGYMYYATPAQQTSEAQFMKELSNTEAELKKSVAYKKSHLGKVK